MSEKIEITGPLVIDKEDIDKTLEGYRFGKYIYINGVWVIDIDKEKELNE